ncbi:ExbD/TolR family protein [Rubrimonas cliftonensis]|uniref:Outer membrane transport energization protein ExbD n=1 Tax=Rubrimonas cliftonensis TaxID=89524 RepID=A0A1H4EZC0_9RHOB|nr:biopolymer transporter ExbD [Rubrimonas cliftonensis]SEA90386.1 outer membrane transport energization protein ExbD [Rubrimonas cliftonensis]
MRRRKPRRRTGGVDDGVLPLINVVFLLLIFFMVAGRLAAGDPFEIAPTRAAMEGPAPGEAPLLLVAADGRLALDGAEISWDALPAALSGARRLRVKADGAADSVALARLLASLRAAGVSEARLMVEPKPGPGP